MNRQPAPHEYDPNASEEAIKYVRDTARNFRQIFGRPYQYTAAMEKFEDDAQTDFRRIFNSRLSEEDFDKISFLLFRRLYERSRQSDAEMQKRESFFRRHPQAAQNNNRWANQAPPFAARNDASDAELPGMNVAGF